MPSWKNASKDDRKRLSAIQIILRRRPDIVDRLFHPYEGSLQTSPENVARGLSSGEKILVNLAIDVWRGSDEARVQNLLLLDGENFKNVMEALIFLRSPLN